MKVNITSKCKFPIAMKILKKLMNKEDIIQKLKNTYYYVKPSQSLSKKKPKSRRKINHNLKNTKIFENLDIELENNEKDINKIEKDTNKISDLDKKDTVDNEVTKD